ncbi:hypothetical protein FRC12_023088 [Ceratobasidium sp. 428]|nr:hypothetical protein FRC12_023088 [Ceratobasidium sp. 428]
MVHIACNQTDWDNQSHRETRPVCHTCLTSGQAIGLSFSTQSGSISLAFVLVLFCVVGVKYSGATSRRGELFKSLSVFMLNLFISELLMSLGGIFDGKWAHEAQVYCGGYCDAQASLQFLGETSVSIWTLAVTVHTLFSVVRARRVNLRPLYTFGIVAAVWIYVLAFNFGAYASVNAQGDEDPANLFAPTPFWCWFGPAHKGKGYAEYIWLWIAGVGNIVVYVPLFLLLRGHIVLGSEGLLSAEWHSTPLPPRSERTGDSASDLSIATGEDSEAAREDCWKMLYYPLAYTILVLPLSVVRWMAFANPDLDALTMAPLGTATMVFHALYRLSGVINVVLVLGTRPNVLLLGKRDRDEDEEEDAHGAGGERNANDGNGLRHRANAAQPTDGSDSTGFGGPAVNLDRDEK